MTSSSTRSGVYVNRLGQVYLGTEPGNAEGDQDAGLYVSRNIVATEKLRWPSGAFVTSMNSTLVLSAPSTIESVVDHVFKKAVFGSGSGYITDTDSNLRLVASNDLILSGSTVVVPTKLSTIRGGTVFFEQDRWVNLVGSLYLSPVDAVRIPEGILLTLGTTSMYGTGTGLVLDSFVTCSSGLLAQDIRIGSAQFQWFNNSLSLGAPGSVRVDCGALELGSCPLVFQQGQVFGSGPDLHLQAAANITLESANVRILGNLIVNGETQFTVTSQTLIDGPILQLGGFQYFDIVAIRAMGDQTILVQVTGKHHLTAVRGLDGPYVIQTVVSESSFTIASSVLLSGATFTGQVRSVLTQDLNKDVGILVNYNSGNGTLGHRTGFFGVDRTNLCWKYYKEATVMDDIVVTGILGNMQVATITAETLAVSRVIAPINFGDNVLTSSRLVATGGSIDGVPIGSNVPASGAFTTLTAQRLEVQSALLVPNLNAFALQGKQPTDFVARDGSTPLLQDWDAGDCIVSLGNVRIRRVESQGVTFMGDDTTLSTDSSFRYVNRILQAPSVQFGHVLQSFDMHGYEILDPVVVNGHVRSCNVTLGPGNVLDVSAGTVVFRSGQISGTAISGRIAEIDITGMSGSV
ncbi:hypothetical protein HK102_012038 [Quaeritorhiza haematococci]|nr:hypothetical protein HK102_012038 [Quaeritorhiza haematococci]